MRESEEKYRVIAEAANDAIITISQESRILYANPATSLIFGYSIDELVGRPLTMLMPESLRSRHRTSLKKFTETGRRSIPWKGTELPGLHKSGRIVPLEISFGAVRRENGEYFFTGIVRDITERKRSESLQAGQRHVFELLARETPLEDVLIELARTIDNHQPGARCSIMILNDEGNRLRKVLGPRLPDEFRAAIEGLEIGPTAGACGIPMQRRERVIVPDLENAPLRTNLRDMALRFGLRAYWCEPIMSPTGHVLGAFALYYNQPHQPTVEELGLIEQAAYIAGVAIDRTGANEALRASEEALRKSHSNLQDLTGKLLVAQEDERRRLARDLHDDLTQRLAALAIEAGKLESSSRSLPKRIRDGLKKVKDQIVNLSEETHRMSRQLHPLILDDLGLVDAIASECARFSEREEIPVDFSPQNVTRALPRDVSLCLYRVIQEALRNIAKHSRAMRVQISLNCKDHALLLAIQDSGIGFVRSQARGRGHLGLASMEERVRLVQGSFSVRSQLGKGTTIEIRVPMIGAD